MQVMYLPENKEKSKLLIDPTVLEIFENEPLRCVTQNWVIKDQTGRVTPEFTLCYHESRARGNRISISKDS